MTNEKINYKEYFITPFIGGVFALTIICFLIKIDSFSKGLLIVLIGSIILSILFGSFFIMTNKILRHRMQKYYLNHKSIKSIEKLGIHFNNKMKCYFGTYRGYDVQILCHFEKTLLIETNYVINIFFDKIDFENVKQIREKEFLNKNNLGDFFIQRTFAFKLFPPSDKKLSDCINDFIDILERNKLKPIRLKDLVEVFNNMTQ
jgi:hypothetical protein